MDACLNAYWGRLCPKEEGRMVHQYAAISGRWWGGLLWGSCRALHEQCLRLRLLRTESATSRIQRIPSPSSSKAAPKLKYSHMVGSTPQPCDPGKLSPDLSHVRSHNISTTLRSCDIQARDPGKVSHDLPRDWSSTRSQVTTQSPDQARFRRAPSPLIGT